MNTDSHSRNREEAPGPRTPGEEPARQTHTPLQTKAIAQAQASIIRLLAKAIVRRVKRRLSESVVESK